MAQAGCAGRTSPPGDEVRRCRRPRRQGIAAGRRRHPGAAHGLPGAPERLSPTPRRRRARRFRGGGCRPEQRRPADGAAADRHRGAGARDHADRAAPRDRGPPPPPRLRLREVRLRDARGTVDARFLRRARDGGAHPIDRFTALGYAGPADAPEEVWRIVGRAGLEALAWRLCARLGPGTDLRAHAREATARGWVVLAAGERNLCGEAGSVSASGAEP